MKKHQHAGFSASGTSTAATEYSDFVIYAQRRSPQSIDVRVYASPAGEMERPLKVSFAAAEAKRIQQSFRTGLAKEGTGQMLITQKEATALGKQLAAVLFPSPVFALFAESLAKVSRRTSGGLRVRLVMDASLSDLPWEYLFRPDRLDHEGVSGFLLLDPKISLVREAAQPRSTLEPISGKQRLDFVGTFWERGHDLWEVRTEFDLLKTALAPVSSYISLRFTAATDPFETKLDGNAGVFHYAGHCDFDADGRPFMIREMVQAGLSKVRKVYVDELAPKLGKSGTRLAVMSACNSGFWPVVKPLLAAGLPAVIGINGGVASSSTIEFCAKLYESLAVGLTLDEAVGRARLHVMEWGKSLETPLFDWGLYMVYMPSPDSVLFPRVQSKALATQQTAVRREHAKTINSTMQLARDLDGLNFGEIMSELTQRRVLILGAFKGRRLKILEAIRNKLKQHPNGYVPELFTFRRSEYRNLVESIVGFASLSRFVIADLSEPRSVPQELDAIVTRFQSVPVVPLINKSGKPFATFADISTRKSVVQPTLRYRDLDDLLQKLDDVIVPSAEAKLNEVRPPED